MRRQLLSLLVAAAAGFIVLLSGTAYAQQKYRGYIRPGYYAPGVSTNPFNVVGPGTVLPGVRTPVSGAMTFPNAPVADHPAFAAGPLPVPPRSSATFPSLTPAPETVVPEALAPSEVPASNPNAPSDVAATPPVVPEAAPIGPTPIPNSQQQPVQQPVQQQFVRPTPPEYVAPVAATPPSYLGYSSVPTAYAPWAYGSLYSAPQYQSTFYAPLTRVYGARGY